MNKKEFVENFATNFLASYVAKHYDDKRYKDMDVPFEDAFWLAEKAWEDMQGMDKDITKYSDE